MTREEEALRRALHAAADSLEPAADGLTRIRSRLSPPRPLGVAWLMAMCAGLAGFAGARLEPVLTWLAERMPAALGPLRAWFAIGAGARHRRRRVWWQQPSVAIGALVVVAATAGIMLSGLPSEIAQGNTQGQTSNQGGGVGGKGGSGLNGNGQPYASPGTSKRGTASPSASCSPSGSNAGRGASPAARPSPSASASPSPSPSASPSPTASPTPSPSPTMSGGPDTPPPSDSATQSDQAGTAQAVGATRLGHGVTSAKASPSPSPTCSPAG